MTILTDEQAAHLIKKSLNRVKTLTDEILEQMNDVPLYDPQTMYGLLSNYEEGVATATDSCDDLLKMLMRRYP